MTITDIEGKVIEVTNLNDAIEQAIMFATMRHEDESFKNLDNRLKIYWTDILNKLKTLKQE